MDVKIVYGFGMYFWCLSLLVQGFTRMYILQLHFCLILVHSISVQVSY